INASLSHSYQFLLVFISVSLRNGIDSVMVPSRFLNWGLVWRLILNMKFEASNDFTHHCKLIHIHPSIQHSNLYFDFFLSKCPLISSYPALEVYTLFISIQFEHVTNHFIDER
ncbi:hypothetical protein BC833DRAFT_597816, partial [Globomyces pollinis-pini]